MQQQPSNLQQSNIFIGAFLVLLLLLIVAIGILFSDPWMFMKFPLEDESAALLALSIVFMLIALIPFALSRKNGKFDWFEVICIISGAYLLTFALRGIYVVFVPAQIGLRYYADTLVQAQFLSLGGFVCLLVGYYVPLTRYLARRVPVPRWRWSLSPGFGKVILLFLIGLGARIALTFESIPSAFQYYLVWLNQLMGLAIGIAILYVFVASKYRRRWMILVLVLLPIHSLFAFIGTGNKITLLEPIFLMVISYHYFKRPISVYVVLILGLVLSLTIFPFIARYRIQRVQLDPLERVTATLIELGSGRFEYSSLAIASVMNRSHLVDSVALIIRYTPEQDLVAGVQTYLLIPAYAFVPRALWPDKPLDSAIAFGHEYLGLSGNTSIGISNPGDLYKNLGVGGVLVGMFALGVFYRVIYEILIAGRRSWTFDTRLPLYFIYFFVLQQLYIATESPVSLGLSELLKQLLLLLLVAFFMRAPLNRP